MGEKRLNELLAAFEDKARFRRKSDGVVGFLMKVIGDGSSSDRVTFVGTTGPECEYSVKVFLKEFEKIAWLGKPIKDGQALGVLSIQRMNDTEWAVLCGKDMAEPIAKGTAGEIDALTRAWLKRVVATAHEAGLTRAKVHR